MTAKRATMSMVYSDSGRSDNTSSPFLDQQAVAEPPAVSDRLEKLLLEWTWQNTIYAKNHTQELWNQLQAEATSYKGAGIVKNAKQALEDANYRIEVNELANQVDDLKALFEEQLTSGPVYEFIAEDTEQSAAVQVVSQVVDSHLRYKRFNQELHTLCSRFAKYKYAGLKVCRSVESKSNKQRDEMPVPSDEELMAFGFPADEEGLAAYLEQAGVRLVGGFDFDDSDRPTTILVESIVPETRKRDLFYIEAFNPRKLAWSSRNRKVQSQFTVHEAHYYSRQELERDGTMANLDKIGDSNAASKNLPGNESDKYKQSNGEHPNFKQFEVWESWQEPPLADWLNAGKASQSEWIALATKFGFDKNSIVMSEGKYRQIPQLWCVFHVEDRALVKLYPTYLIEKGEFPYDIASYIEADDELVGGGFQERPSDFNDAMHVMYNLMLTNLRQLLGNNYFVSERAEISQDNLDKTRKYNQFIRLKGNAQPTDVIMPVPVADATEPAMKGISLFEKKIEDLGVAAILQGKGAAETATQDAINNQRGQTGVNSATRRLVDDVLIPAITKVAGMVVANFTTPQVIEIAGESGTTLRHDKITPKQLTDKFRIVSVGSFDVADQQMKSQLLVSIANVFAPVLMPQEMRGLLELFLRYTRFSKTEIEKIMSLSGLDTDVKAEIRTMIEDPFAEIAVRPEDPHDQAVAYAMAAAQLFPQLQQQENFQNYLMEHQAYLNQMMMMQQSMGGGGKSPKGPPNQVSKEQPDSATGMTRRDAQFNSPVDNGASTAAGLTGAAMV